VKLSVEERAAVVTAVLCGAPAALARLARGERCVAEAKRLGALPREERARALADEAAALAAEVPAGVALIHPSWLEHASAGEADAVRAIVAGGDAPAAARRFVRRRLLGAFVDMPPSGLAAAAPERLAAAIEIVGRRRLALAAQAAGPAAAAALAARLPAEQRRAFADDARAPGPDAGAAVRELADLVGAGGAQLLFHAGARHLAGAFLAEGDLGRQVAQRLPRALGVVLLAELARATRGQAGALDALRAALDQ
jgi:hypothetical protein